MVGLVIDNPLRVRMFSVGIAGAGGDSVGVSYEFGYCSWSAKSKQPMTRDNKPFDDHLMKFHKVDHQADSYLGIHSGKLSVMKPYGTNRLTWCMLYPIFCEER